jgi:hypothetical protein
MAGLISLSYFKKDAGLKRRRAGEVLGCKLRRGGTVKLRVGSREYSVRAGKGKGMSAEG